jgi:hypothetical protein
VKDTCASLSDPHKAYLLRKAMHYFNTQRQHRLEAQDKPLIEVCTHATWRNACRKPNGLRHCDLPGACCLLAFLPVCTCLHLVEQALLMQCRSAEQCSPAGFTRTDNLLLSALEAAQNV